MPISFTPKFKRNLNRVLPFGLIWLLTGWFFLLSETLLTGNRNPDPDSAITLTIPILIFSSMAIAFVGLLVGLIELVILEKRFRHLSFAKKVIYKFIIYMILMFLIMLVSFPIAATIELSLPITDPIVINKTFNFFQSRVFLNTTLQLSFHLVLSLLYAAISENLGHQVTLNFFTGKYHRPKQEERIFMFLDMKDSTKIAEALGHVRYFDLLQSYYELMSDSIINTKGEVYQYIGDEVVITWLAKEGFQNNHCIKCFESLKERMREERPGFEKEYGIAPDFKAGLHVGNVTTGEIGALKKQIVYSGDVLNTTARIQGLCKEYKADLIISEQILQGLEEPSLLNTQLIGEVQLKGKQQSISLYSLSEDS